MRRRERDPNQRRYRDIRHLNDLAEVGNPHWTFGTKLLAGIIVAAVGFALIASVRGGGGSSSRPAPTAPGLHAGPPDMTLPVTAPNVGWEMVGGPTGIAVPDGRARWGPIYREDHIHGYSHDSVGALIAMLGISARITVGDGWRATADNQLTGPGKDVFIAWRATDAGTPPAAGWCSYVGYRYVSADPDNVAISLATACPSGTLNAGTSNVAWTGNDWSLTMNGDGSSSSDARPITSLAGYTTFAQGSGNSATGRD